MPEPVIMLREIISVGRLYGGWPRGMISLWPAHLNPPSGTIWLREGPFWTQGPGDTAIETYGDFTKEAKELMEELSNS